MSSAARCLNFGQSCVQGLGEQTWNAVREARDGQRRDIYQSGDSGSPPISSDNENDDFPDDRPEKNRFDTFIDRIHDVEPMRLTNKLVDKLLMLTASGFLCSSDGSAECFCCHFRISFYEWLRTDNPQNYHYHTSHCRFLRGEETGNVPLTSEEKEVIQSTYCPSSNAATSSVYDTPPREDALFRELHLPMRLYPATFDIPSASGQEVSMMYDAAPVANDQTPPVTPERCIR